jgi:hypothetical protein
MIPCVRTRGISLHNPYLFVEILACAKLVATHSRHADIPIRSSLATLRTVSCWRDTNAVEKLVSGVLKHLRHSYLPIERVNRN